MQENQWPWPWNAEESSSHCDSVRDSKWFKVSDFVSIFEVFAPSSLHISTLISHLLINSSTSTKPAYLSSYHVIAYPYSICFQRRKLFPLNGLLAIFLHHLIWGASARLGVIIAMGKNRSQMGRLHKLENFGGKTPSLKPSDLSHVRSAWW